MTDLIIGGVTLRRDWREWSASCPGNSIRVWHDGEQWVGVIRSGDHELSTDHETLAGVIAALELAQATQPALEALRNSVTHVTRNVTLPEAPHGP